MAFGLSLSERPDGEQIKRFRPLHRPNRPKQNRNFHQTLVRLTTRRFGDIAPGREKGCLNFLYRLDRGKPKIGYHSRESAMSDDRIYDAIHVFQISPTGRGTRRIDGDAAYQQKYVNITHGVLTLLWELWRRERIHFSNIFATSGDYAYYSNREIWVDVYDQPTQFRESYHLPEHQRRVAFLALDLVHEATHGVFPASDLETEIAARTLASHFLADVVHGVSYQSRVTGECHLARVGAPRPGTTAYQSYEDLWYDRLDRHIGQMIDGLLDMKEYQGLLTADFVRRSIDWWGGLGNRSPRTKARFLKVLVEEGPRNDELVLRIVESLRGPSEYQAVMEEAPAEALRAAMHRLRARGQSFPVRIDVAAARLDPRLALQISPH